MGCSISCSECCGDSGGYEEIKDTEIPIEMIVTPEKQESPKHENKSSNGTPRTPLLDLDFNSPVFKGTTADQKFANKATYDQKFVWVNIRNRTLNLSEYKSKEKRHKEANIADIVNVVAGPPEKYKAKVNENGEPEKINFGQCLSVTFVRGGAIDLKFETEAERDAWYIALTKLMAIQREEPAPAQSVGLSSY